MKPLVIWIAVVAAVFGAFALVTNLTRDTERVFVVVDSSFQMQPVWSDVRRELDRIDDAEYSEFALATEKDLIHSWQAELELVGVEPFAPCTFDGVDQYPEVDQANELVLITTSTNTCDTSALVGWQIIQLTP